MTWFRSPWATRLVPRTSCLTGFPTKDKRESTTIAEIEKIDRKLKMMVRRRADRISASSFASDMVMSITPRTLWEAGWKWHSPEEHCRSLYIGLIMPRIRYPLSEEKIRLFEEVASRTRGVSSAWHA